VSDNVTDCAEVYVPGSGLKVGVAVVVRLMVYVPLATALLLKPVAIAMASMVVVAFTGIGELYTVELAVGVVPVVG
jgi:hypothetical protein